jgi:small subunit ribosomal protein S4
MGRYLGSSCKHCRREGMKLMLKGIRCETAKCPIEKKQRNLAPGMHGWRRGRVSEYGVRLREKQKVKRYYGLMQRQFMRCFRRAERMKGNTGETLLQLLEFRTVPQGRQTADRSRPHLRKRAQSQCQRLYDEDR